VQSATCRRGLATIVAVKNGTRRRHVGGLPLKEIRVEVIGATNEPVVGVDPVRVGSAEGNDIVLDDPMVSRYHLELARDGGRVAIIDLGSTNGTSVAAASFCDGRVTVSCPAVVTLGDTKLRLTDGSVVMLDLPSSEALGGLRGRSPAMRRLMGDIVQVAPKAVGVLVLGESGTGKELIARAIHDNSDRASGPFVTLDCASVAPTLFASELLGHERGAFTGAQQQHIGAVERAHGGTLFIDEVGELPTETQAKLLGCLERRRIVRLGSQNEREVDIRVVAATHRDLRAEVNRGRFRLDLFYRLAVVQLNVPALRERPDDVPLLIDHFLDDLGFEGSAEALFDEDSLVELKRHSWPGNVRELRNVVASAMAMGSPGPLQPDEEPSDDPRDPIGRVLSLPYREGRAKVVGQFERRYLVALLERCEGNVRRAAREAKMDRSYLIELLTRHDLR
jgi:DNA-binding NtrC family response regulator